MTINIPLLIEDDTLIGAQRGLMMRAIFGQIININLKNHNDQTRETLLKIIKDIDCDVNENRQNCGFIVGFNADLWGKWRSREIPIVNKVLDQGIKFKMVPCDILIYVKAPQAEIAKEIFEKFKPRLDEIAESLTNLAAGKRPDARIMSGRYVDSITNPNDPISMTEDVLISDEFPGSCFAFTQNFIFDWDAISANLPDSQDQMIGRNKDGGILSQHTPHGHIHKANVRDVFFNQRKLLRQALPYGHFKRSAGREEGLIFVGFCNEQARFEEILQNLLGDTPGMPSDRLMSVVEGKGGNYFYIPAAQELDIRAVRGGKDVYEDPRWDVRSDNGYMFYNPQDYLHKMASNDYIAKDAPTPRILSLISRTFNHWHDGWVHRQTFPRLPHLSEMKLEGDDKAKVTGPILIRKGLANRESLIKILSGPTREDNPDYYELARDNGLLRIEPKELIVGVIPDFTFGRGKEVMPYLNKDEQMLHWLNGSLSEFAAMGHVVPHFEKLVKKGLGTLVKETEELLKNSKDSKAHFYESVLLSLKGVQGYLRNWADIAAWAITRATSVDDVDNMTDVAQRLERLVDKAPESFQDAVQLVYSYHCCLHLVGELTALGCLDRIFQPFLKPTDDMIRAQEIIDCLWIKIGENAFVSRAFIEDYVTYGTTSVNGVCGNFPQGDGINQWCQQITVGGYEAASGTPKSAANDVTMLCLKAARRLPLNAPTLSLRVHKGMDQKLVDEAAMCVLSGGAHPILFNDDKLCEGLLGSGGGVDEAWSRNYAADGCYEPMFCRASAFSFSNVTPMLALEQTINQGSTYGQAGPVHLRGLKASFRSPPAEDIHTFEQLKEIFFKQCEWLMVQCDNFLLSNMGNLADVCPSPLLSVLIEGCMESGRDLTDGGAKFHIVAPMCIGIPNAIDSLYAIKRLVYDSDSALTTLPELVRCLSNDWGFDMKEPFQSQLTGLADAQGQALRFHQLREYALELPKWGGSGNEELENLGTEVIDRLAVMCNDVMRDPHPVLKPAFERLSAKYGKDFQVVVCPGIGTFEGYVGDGIPCGASADGRRSGMPIASDLSPTPGAQDLPPMPAFRNIYQSMAAYKGVGAEIKFSNSSPVDMNISENFPLEDLKKFIRDYSEGTVGGNLITLTCADLDTYQAATEDPEKYQLLRVRMGGWTEFYATMFPAHQDQHQRRQYFSEKSTEQLEKEKKKKKNKKKD